MKPDILRRHYKEKASSYKNWDQKDHAEDYMVFPENIGEYLSIDEVSLLKGELYTFVTNKAGKGKKGSRSFNQSYTVKKHSVGIRKTAN